MTGAAGASRRPVLPPRDAAGVVVLRDGRRGPEVLLGRRSRRARFMPSVYVFPGGGLDPLDRRASGFLEPLARPQGPVDAATRRRLAALARCALREVWEETGLLLGRPGRPEGAADDLAGPWRPFAEAGLTPAFEGLSLVARAITPARSPIRFHTRFFLLDGLEPTPAGQGDGELEDVGFVPTAEALDRPMSSVTALVLAECMARRRDPARPSRLFAWRLGETPIYR
ncbi:MAG: NUDIX domain-containing protein [Tistlia sp.]|uniref:NUDIX hydrolase n=1 Tax=Tistlia sp. TaxID=3057121 RepID=UPI0034A183AA